jgi:hypothetical protein
LKLIKGLEIRALCDIRKERVEVGQKALMDIGLPAARTYGKTEDDWKKLCTSPDLDLIYIVTPWDLHTPMSVFAMENGKHAAVEVPAAVTIKECWRLVETSERTRKHCMMLENCCYDFFELLTLNMARQGLFGEIVHGEGAYIHWRPTARSPALGPVEYSDAWRMQQVQKRAGNMYPTHGLGPICQAMNINRGDRFDYMSSVTCNDFVVGRRYEELAKSTDFFKQFDPKSQIGNVNTSIIRTAKGKTIMLQFAVTVPRVYSRIHLLSGTKGSAQKYPLPGKIALGGSWLSEEKVDELTKKHSPEIVRRIGTVAKQDATTRALAHGGMDLMMDWRLIDCLRNGLPLDQDVYDAALWSSIMPLSDWSVANRSNSIDVPDFTGGSYIRNVPLDLSLSQGGNTGVRPG